MTNIIHAALLDALAALLEYPRGELDTLLDTAVERSSDEGRIEIALFADAISALRPTEREEAYAAMFELGTSCTLDIGYHLFGETYKRGLFLSHLAAEHADVGLELAGQLPDHLPSILRLLPRMHDHEVRDALIAFCVLPAVERMRPLLEEKGSPYAHLLAAITIELRSLGLPLPDHIELATLEVMDHA